MRHISGAAKRLTARRVALARNWPDAVDSLAIPVGRSRPVTDIQSVRKRSSKSNEAKLKRDFWRRCGWLPGNPFVLLCWAAARSAGTGSADGGWPDTEADAAKRILFLMMMKGEGSCNGGNSSYS